MKIVVKTIIACQLFSIIKKIYNYVFIKIFLKETWFYQKYKLDHMGKRVALIKKAILVMHSTAQ